MQNIDFESGIWAVASAPGFGLVLGAIHLDTALMENIEEHIAARHPVFISPCFGFKADVIPVQGPQGMGVSIIRQCTPLANCAGPGALTTVVESVLLFKDMTAEDKSSHKALVEQLLQQLTAIRLEKAGIKPAGLGDMPNGPIIKP